MRPQYFSWLFDDKNAWEKSLADPRYSYELPIDSFMAIYQIDRKAYAGNMPELAMPVFSAPTTVVGSPIVTAASPFPTMPAVVASSPPPKEEPKQEGILSQDEIDALLSGI